MAEHLENTTKESEKKRGKPKIRTEAERKEIVRLKNQRYYEKTKKARAMLKHLENTLLEK